MKKLFSILLLFLSLAATGQDVTIPLEEFTLEIPRVNALVVRPIGAPYLAPNPADTVQKIMVQNVYYELRSAVLTRAAEEGNKTLPNSKYQLVNKYIDRSVTPSDTAEINAFFRYVNWPLKVKLPSQE
ncbi:hypothetical protein [Salmonirosea aquatica]|uniref:DUF4294 domain-containing protein n=1 Tax=Salmonirosea aquatica TaxID=2654236 RepID=A0A7C9FBV1_9BACT|nr:hypothetical protein [Cytophagaceae bacterium SJW1-29]MPR37124.1 hypothetical protein [Cytophagaceae bacterium SJW1-29]